MRPAGVWGPALRRSTAWFECTLMSCDGHEWGGMLLLASHPARLPQQPVTAAPHNYSAGQYLQHNGSMYTWTIPLACFRERHIHAHTHVHLRESERLERTRTVEKMKMVLPSVCGMTSVQGCWGKGRWGREKGNIWNGCAGRGDRTHWQGKGMSLKVREMIEAGEPEKGSTQVSVDSPKW